MINYLFILKILENYYVLGMKDVGVYKIEIIFDFILFII